jgi:ferric-dicitrate binding protein FerR (iron transport regulator)
MRNLLGFFSKVAAILILPLLIYMIYLTSGTNRSPGSGDNPIAWRTVKTTTGMQTDFYLPDGTHVWLNSGSVLKYPVPFAKGRRQTELMGEAYFDVTKDTLHPFLVNAGKMNIEVKGTRFNVVNYPDETVTELILECGSVRLFSGNYDDHKTISYVKPGEIATLDKSQNQLTINRVEVGKYTAWREGTLIFREDKMDEVVRKLNRWFNVEVILQSPELKEYVYTATYRDETLTQIMELLKISAPIKYRITDRVRLPDNSFSKRRIYITKQN